LTALGGITKNINDNNALITTGYIGPGYTTYDKSKPKSSFSMIHPDTIFKLKIDNRIETKEDFFKFLNKELNKIYYLTKVFTNLHAYKLETNFKSFELIFLKYLFFQTRKLKESLIDKIDIEISLYIPRILEYIKLPEYRSFETEINSQYEKLSILYSLQKKEFSKNNVIDSDLDSDLVFNFKRFLLTLANFVEEVKIDYLFSKKTKFLAYDASKYIFFLNELIDAVLVEELFNKFINDKNSMANQKYFEDIKNSPIDSILKLVSQKIEFAKTKYNY